ncbi:MAG TPA: hypothetical protein VND92_01125 [Vicinamibacterales bacterium]|nr:hypothetical protein [Vicinamibacterales bacterium]
MSMERVICVPLSDAEWRAFLAVQPQPVAWLQQQIRQQVQVAASRDTQPSQTARSVAVN